MLSSLICQLPAWTIGQASSIPVSAVHVSQRLSQPYSPPHPSETSNSTSKEPKRLMNLEIWRLRILVIPSPRHEDPRPYQSTYQSSSVTYFGIQNSQIRTSSIFFDSIWPPITRNRLALSQPKQALSQVAQEGSSLSPSLPSSYHSA